jgi:hypothetical protein
MNDENEKPPFKLKLFGCTLIELIIKDAQEFFGDKPVDAIAFNAYVQGAAAIQAAQLIVISNRETLVMAEKLSKNFIPEITGADLNTEEELKKRFKDVS